MRAPLAIFVITSAILIGSSPARAGGQDSDAPPPLVPGSSVGWPQFHFTADHQGFNPYETALSPSTVGGLKVRWSIHPIPFANIQSPVLVGGVLYFGVLFATPSTYNSVFAVDATTGDLLWQSEATQDGFLGAPAVGDGLVFASSDFPAKLFAFDEATGATVWTALVASQSANGLQPTYANGLVFVASTQFGGKLFAFDAPTGTPVWSVSIDGDYVIGPPAVSGDTVYVGGQEGGLYAFRASTGTPKWKADVGGSGFAGIAAGTGLIFAGNQDHQLYAFDADTGAVVWTFQADAEVLSSPAFAYGTVFVGSDGRYFYAIDASSGRRKWRYTGTLSRYFNGSPAVANGVVYEAEYGLALHAFDARTGYVLWSSGIIAQDTNSPIVADGVVYVTTYDGYAIAYGL